MTIKTENFLWGMVSADFWGFRNMEKDSQAVSLAGKIEAETGRKNESFPFFYATRLIYTENLTFKWKKKAPSEYTALEDWWTMVKNGESSGDCYLFYITNVSNVVTNEWMEALERAQTIWIPSDEDWEDEENPDPN